MAADWKAMGPRYDALLAQGLSAAKIAEALNSEFDCKLTRNAVIGRRQRQAQAPNPQPVAFPQHQFAARKPDLNLRYEPISLLDARLDQCRWIEHEPVGDCMCGQKVKLGSSWYEAHHKRTFYPRTRRSQAQVDADEIRARKLIQAQRQRRMGLA
jgi:hypothetical protein